MGLFLMKIILLRSTFTLFLWLNLAPKDLLSWLVVWNFFPLRLLFISINLKNGLTSNTAVMSRLVLIGTVLVEVHLSCLNCFHFLTFVAGPITTLVFCMVFFSSVLDVIRMSMLTVSFLIQLDSGILCLHNALLQPMIWVALSYS